MLSITYDDLKQPVENNYLQVASIDLGEIHSITSIRTGGEGVIITGRKIRSIKRLRNKKITELTRKMSKCKKGSRQWKKYKKALNFTKSKTERQLTDVIHKTTKQYVDWCIENEVGEVAVGEVEGVQRNRSRRNKKVPKHRRRARKTNQKLSQWQFGKIKQYLAYKLYIEGITLKTVSEAYTSQTCPVCDRRKKVSSRNYRCSCGYTNLRDIHGAGNILSKHLYDNFQPMEIFHITYLRIA